MKVCILTHTFPKYPDDTTAAFMHPLVMGIAAVGDQVTVLTPYHKQLKINSFPYNIISYKYTWPDRLHVLGYSQTLRNGTHFRISSYLLAPLLIIFGIIALLRLTKRNSYDIICAHWIVPNGIIAAVVSAITHIPFTVTLAGSDVYVAQKNFFFALMARWATERAAFICADSPQYFKELELTGARFNKRLIIPYPVDTSAIRPTLQTTGLRKKIGIALQDNILLSVGRLIEKKGFEVMLRALPAIIKRYHSLRYLIVGEGDDRIDLERQADALGVRNHVYFIGNVNRRDIHKFYSMADIVVVPSIKDHEGNIDDRPVVIIEAMACGKVVVASHFSGNALTIKHGIDGILVPPADQKKLSDTIIKLLSSRSYRIKLGVHARQKVKTTFHHTIIGKQYHDLFIRILQKNEKHADIME